MKKLHINFVSCLVFSVFLFSCSKSSNPVSTPAPAGPYSSIDTIFSMLSLQPKTVTIDAAAGGSFTGNSGTRYIFMPNCFITSTGANVTGSVQIQATEYLLEGDMLFSKALPVSNNQPLMSGGEIHVSATQGGQQLFLKPMYNFVANMPTPRAKPTGLQFFSGQPALDTTQLRINWIQPAVDSTHYNVGTVSVTSGGDTVSIFSDSLKWCNADAFLSGASYQTFTVTISLTGASLPSTARAFGYALYDTYKGIWPLGVSGSYANGVFTETHVPNIPVHFAAFAIVNGDFYGGVSGATPASGMNYTITLTKIDPVAFKANLNTL